MLLEYLDEAFGSPAVALYISADHIHVAAAGLYAIAEVHHLNGGKLLCTDEIHKYPEWRQATASRPARFSADRWH